MFFSIFGVFGLGVWVWVFLGVFFNFGCFSILGGLGVFNFGCFFNVGCFGSGCLGVGVFDQNLTWPKLFQNEPGGLRIFRAFASLLPIDHHDLL